MKNPPHTYIQKLRGYLDPGVTRKVGQYTDISIIISNDLNIKMCSKVLGTSLDVAYASSVLEASGLMSH